MKGYSRSWKKHNRIMYGTVEITKGWDTWYKLSEEMKPEMEAVGMKFLFKGCEMDEKKFMSSWKLNQWKKQRSFPLTLKSTQEGLKQGLLLSPQLWSH